LSKLEEEKQKTCKREYLPEVESRAINAITYNLRLTRYGKILLCNDCVGAM
jgi:hypothetical protein